MLKRVASIGLDCVACGNCVSACPKGAISICKGMWAEVDFARCVGCGKCEQACPAGIIEMRERPGETA